MIHIYRYRLHKVILLTVMTHFSKKILLFHYWPMQQECAMFESFVKLGSINYFVLCFLCSGPFIWLFLSIVESLKIALVWAYYKWHNIPAHMVRGAWRPASPPCVLQWWRVQSGGTVGRPCWRPATDTSPPRSTPRPTPPTPGVTGSSRPHGDKQ